MKNLILILFILLAKICEGQDIIDPYNNYDGQSVTSLLGIPSFNTLNNIHQYDGEYVIFLDLFPWGNIQKLIGGMNNDLDLDKFALSYEIELVSFPFSPECAFPTANNPDGGCANSLDRVFRVPPDNIFDQLGNLFWEYQPLTTGFATKLYNFTDKLEMQRGPLIISAFPKSNSLACLVSNVFNSTSGASDDRFVLPHSILKHTINLHCGSSISNQILGSFYFYTDLTRGRMREYPFKDNSVSITNTVDHDVMVRPFLIGSHYQYNNTSTENCNYYRTNNNHHCNNDPLPGYEGNNINYTPYNPASDDFCNAVVSNYVNTNLGDIVSAPPNMQHLPLPDYSLIASSSVRNVDGTTLAGYVGYTGQSTMQMIYTSPIVHQYTIDKNITLSNINPSEKIIYNPSEVDILADDLRFPTNYTFKTIRGTFPFATEVDDAAQNPKNGGPFTDPTKRDVPVPTDLFKDFHITQTQYSPSDHMLASLYHLQSGSKLTIEPCVKIFDATFEINPGSEMVFESWNTNQINVDRYQLLYNGGIVTKKDYSFLFQNFIESRKILRYESGDFISAGENVDVTAATGDYIIDQGADVTFKAENQITLEPGFEVKTGGDFLASIGPVIVPACGPLRLKSPNAFKENQNEIKEEINYFVCSPNPVTENTFFMFEIKDKSNVTISIYDVMGNLVEVIGQKSLITKGRYTYSYQVKNLSSGLYIAKLNTGNSEKSLKFIKQ